MSKRKAPHSPIALKMMAVLDKSTRLTRGVLATEQDLRLAEQFWTIKLPKSYAVFQQKYGNATICGDEFFGVAESLPVHINAIDQTAHENIRGMFKLPCGYFVVLQDGRGGLYTVNGNKRVNGESPVVHWEHEFEPPELQKPRLVARSFGAFVLRLERQGYID